MINLVPTINHLFAPLFHFSIYLCNGFGNVNLYLVGKNFIKFRQCLCKIPLAFSVRVYTLFQSHIGKHISSLTSSMETFHKFVIQEKSFSIVWILPQIWPTIFLSSVAFFFKFSCIYHYIIIFNSFIVLKKSVNFTYSNLFKICVKSLVLSF